MIINPQNSKGLQKLKRYLNKCVRISDLQKMLVLKIEENC